MYTDIINFMNSCLVLLFFSIIEVSKWIIVVLSKWQPQNTYSALCTFSDNQNIWEVDHLWWTHNYWTFYIVLRWVMGRYLCFPVLFCQLKPNCLQNHDWDAGSFLTVKMTNCYFFYTSNGWTYIMFIHRIYTY